MRGDPHGFHGFRCKNGYDSGGNLVYRAICPILDLYPGFVELDSVSPKESEPKRFEYTVLSYYDVKAMDAEAADYLFVNAFDLLICHIVEFDGISRKDWWACQPGYWRTVFHPWWVDHHVEFEAEIDAYFHDHPF